LLLLEKVRESLAGRCGIIELYPLTLPELQTSSSNTHITDSLFQHYLVNPVEAPVFFPSFLFDPRMAQKQSAWDYYCRFGAYPALTNSAMTDDERYAWLGWYVKTYLERDIRDLASFRDLEPFIKLQQYLALQTGQQINASSIAVQLGISVNTVKRYIRYFELSYQLVSLSAWTKNANKRLSKMPKIHYMDNGVLQAVLLKRGGITGNEFESLVIAEIFKQVKCLNMDARFYHYRTHDGSEVDLLLEMESGYIAFEIKMTEKVRPTDARHVKNLGEILDKPLLHSFILSNDTSTTQIAPGITACNVAYFLG
jgi:predicted AAA+ superfamily ATPase